MSTGQAIYGCPGNVTSHANNVTCYARCTKFHNVFSSCILGMSTSLIFGLLMLVHDK